MPATLTIRGETPGLGDRDHVFNLEFPTESITVRELIRARIYQEVDDYNRELRSAEPAKRYQGLVQPTPAEQRLNPDQRQTKRREVDWRKQFDLATEAFERRQVLVLVGDHQTESLDETIEIGRGTEVTFLRLVMLVGG